LEDCGKSAIANAQAKLSQLRTGKECEQIEPILQCEDAAKIPYFIESLFMANFSKRFKNKILGVAGKGNHLHFAPCSALTYSISIPIVNVAHTEEVITI
jgi:hypothetical protein